MRVSVVLPPETYDALAKDAREQYRRLPDQAAYVIAKALEARAPRDAAPPVLAAMTRSPTDATH